MKFLRALCASAVTINLTLLMAVNSKAQIFIPKFDVQGHRGARGLMPENTVPGFMMALDSGVTTLELDLVITKDKRVVVSHEPYMNAEFCLDPNGKAIKQKDEKKFNIYKMNYDEVKLWDCGSKGNSKLKEQQKISISKPLLTDVIVAVENHIKNFSKYEVDYNLEIKSEKGSDGIFHPKPEAFSDLVFNAIDQYLPWDRIVIQSFDMRVLKYWHQKYPKVRLALLIDNLKEIKQNLDELGFIPDIYSPEFHLLDANEVTLLHKYSPTRTLRPDQKLNTLRVIPWTVNEETDMKELKDMGVDGIITDYPNRARNLKLTLTVKK